MGHASPDGHIPVHTPPAQPITPLFSPPHLFLSPHLHLPRLHPLSLPPSPPSLSPSIPSAPKTLENFPFPASTPQIPTGAARRPAYRPAPRSPSARSAPRRSPRPSPSTGRAAARADSSILPGSQPSCYLSLAPGSDVRTSVFETFNLASYLA